MCHGGIALVARVDAKKCLQMIIEQRWRFHGYDGFTVFTNGEIQPHLEWSASWKWDRLPVFDIMLEDLLESPPEVTHFEFVFSDTA